jgi:two-component system, cell cycle sensor histidine kinase and response regulator CckA
LLTVREVLISAGPNQGKHVEETLLQIEEQFGLLVSSTKDCAILILDPSGQKRWRGITERKQYEGVILAQVPGRPTCSERKRKTVNPIDYGTGEGNMLAESTEPKGAGHPTSRTVGIGVPLSVLIVEDSEDDAVIVLRELQQAGYDIDFKRVDSHDALQANLVARTWDLVISDFAMPGFSGTEALKLIRSSGSDAPFIFISGTMGEDIAIAALKDGAQDYLVKNNLKRLVPAVQRELQKAEERRQRKRLEEHLQGLQKFESIGRLAGGVAHDFNNLLGVILGQTEILLEVSHPPETVLGLEMIRDAANRGAGLSRQLLAFGRRQVFETKVLNLNKTLTDLESLLRRVIGEDIELEFQTETNLRTVEADPSQLEQVILNLAVNARDAMPTGGKLNIATANLDLDEAYSDRRVAVKPGRYVQIIVRDTGCGMDEQTQSRIFEPFFTTKEPGKGTGLGLATVFGIVKQSGGFIWVYSELGHGTAFKIYLPVVEAAAEAPRILEVRPQMPRGSETILVVDDDASLREVTCQFLGGGGYTVLAAESPDQALQLAESHHGAIDFLLTDVIMPKMNGRELAARLIKKRPMMKVLYISGYADGIVQDGTYGPLEDGLAFLQKPYTRKQIMAKIRELLDM